MNDEINSNPSVEEQTGNKSERKNRVRQWIFALFFKHGVLYTLAFSIIVFALYMIGSMSDPVFSDDMLFFLLRLLQYSSLLLCVFSLFSLGAKVRRLVYHPSLRNFVGLFLYFIAGLFGAALAMFNSFIIVASKGNV